MSNENTKSVRSEQHTAVRSSAWLAAAQELASLIYGGKLNMREVPTETFLAWWEWRQETSPNSESGIPLKYFDIESAMMFFEDDVKAANDGGQR